MLRRGPNLFFKYYYFIFGPGLFNPLRVPAKVQNFSCSLVWPWKVTQNRSNEGHTKLKKINIWNINWDLFKYVWYSETWKMTNFTSHVLSLQPRVQLLLNFYSAEIIWTMTFTLTAIKNPITPHSMKILSSWKKGTHQMILLHDIVVQYFIIIKPFMTQNSFIH